MDGIVCLNEEYSDIVMCREGVGIPMHEFEKGNGRASQRVDITMGQQVITMEMVDNKENTQEVHFVKAC